MISQEEVQRLTELEKIWGGFEESEYFEVLEEIFNLLPKLLADRERMQGELEAAKRAIAAYYSQSNLGMKEEDK